MPNRFPKRYEVCGDHVVVSQELHRTLNILAGRFYSQMGYKHIEGFDYSSSLHPQEQLMYAFALEAAYLQQSTGALDD
ncbi:hypothetical protein ACPV5O_20975 [Vibrio maritimus]|jgi:hypothetical protein|uniref:Uncharacterized protein n=1 Tax=Vibrio chaetopteri TaxID=3016528 RepID=A0AAU8BR05_9VIBR